MTDRSTVSAWSGVSLLLCLLFSSSAAFADLCSSAAGLRAGSTLDIIPEDRTVQPWSNETPRDIRSSDTVDGLVSLRVDLSHWSPVAFDAHQSVLSGDYDFLELKIRSSISNPPLSVITSGGTLCSLSDFAQLQAGTWSHMQIPLLSLGYSDTDRIGRIKLKSAVADPFTVWVTDVRLAVNDRSTDIPPEPEEPELPEDETPPESDANGLVSWDRDPGVAGSIDDHLPDNRITVQANGNDLLDDSAEFLAAIEAINGGGIVLIPAGTYYLSVPLELKQDSQILRGSGPDLTRLVFTRAQAFGIGITGQYPKDRTQIIKADYLSDEMHVVSTTAFNPGSYAVITDQGSPVTQVVKILEQNQRRDDTRLKLQEPLNTSFTSTATMQVFNATEYSGVENLTLDVIDDSVYVNDMLFFRSTANSWVRNVVSKRPRQSHVYTRQSYHCEISKNSFDNATGHGDGKQGYGIDLANSTTGCLVENNVLTHLRHAILLNQGANGNVVAFNHSQMPRHTNFANGGPGDISFHHYAFANLVEGNVVERIHIGDAGAVGGGNMIHRNCLTSGPLTVDNSPDATQYLIGNVMYGSDDRLRLTIMPPVLPETPNPRPYLGTGSTLFGPGGITLSPVARAPVLSDNWHAGTRGDVTITPRNSYYGSAFPPAPDTVITGNWLSDCAIPAVARTQQ